MSNESWHRKLRELVVRFLPGHIVHVAGTIVFLQPTRWFRPRLRSCNLHSSWWFWWFTWICWGTWGLSREASRGFGRNALGTAQVGTEREKASKGKCRANWVNMSKPFIGWGVKLGACCGLHGPRSGNAWARFRLKRKSDHIRQGIKVNSNAFARHAHFFICWTEF